MNVADVGSVADYGHELLRLARNLPAASLHRRSLRLHDLRIDAWFSDPVYADLCERNLACASDAGGAAQITTLFLLDAASLDWPPPRRWGGDMLDRQAINVELARAGLHGAYLHDPRVWQFHSRDLRLGVQLIRHPGATPPWETGGPLRVFLHWAFAGSSARLCHAATLGLDGKGVLLAGSGGSGKSGTTLAGIAAGLATVGDDYSLVAQEEAVAAYPLYRLLKQDPAGVNRVWGADACKRFGETNWQDKFEIHASALPRSPFVQRLEIGAILLPRVARLGRTGLRRVSAGAAMRDFAPSSVFQLPDGEHEGVRFTAELCRRLPCYELLLSEDAGDIGQTLRAFLERMPL